MSLTDATNPAASASPPAGHTYPSSLPTRTGVSAPDDRPWPAEREEITLEVSSATESRAWFKQWLSDAGALFKLPPNWNGYGERPVHASALKRAARVLDAMDYDGTAPALSPRHDGSVQVEWHVGSSSVELVVHPNGPTEAWVFSDEGEETWAVQTTVDALRLGSTVRALLGADD